MIIEIEKEGDIEYCYIKHSIRKKKRVVTKRKYLGTSIPKDIDRIKEEFYRELNAELFEKLEKIKSNFQKEWKRTPVSAKQRELEEIAIGFTYNTNAIEGSKITLSETRGIVSDGIAPRKDLKDIEETKRHFEIFLEMLSEKEKKVDGKLLLDWHEALFSGTKKDISGKFRDYLVRVGSYIAPDHIEMKKLLEEFYIFMKNAKHNRVELAARAHYIFEKIHPFGDGNGRVGRLLMNYILWHSGYPMIIIEYKNRNSYYKALERDEQGFVNYFLKRYIKVHEGRIS